MTRALKANAQQDVIHTLGTGSNGRPFEDKVSKCIFLNENFCIWIQISMMFVSDGVINNTCYWFRNCLGQNRRQAIIQTRGDPDYWRIYASSYLNESVNDELFITHLTISSYKQYSPYWCCYWTTKNKGAFSRWTSELATVGCLVTKCKVPLAADSI